MLGIPAGDASSRPAVPQAGAPGGQAVAVWASAARIGAGVRAAATMTSRKASDWSTIPNASFGIGSPNTMMPPAMQETLAPALVIVITGTASPVWSPRAEAKNAITEAAMQVKSQGEATTPTRPSEP